MKTLIRPNYYFISENELNLHLKYPSPVYKVNLYREKLEKPLNTVYIKLLKQSKMEFQHIDKVIRSIVKDHASYALAFQFERINFTSIMH